MTISSEKNASALTVTVEGRLDYVSAHELDEFLETNLTGVTDLTLDFAKLEYISSSGLRTLLRTQKQMSGCGGKMRLLHVSDVVREVLELTGFDTLLTIED